LSPHPAEDHEESAPPANHLFWRRIFAIGSLVLILIYPFVLVKEGGETLRKMKVEEQKDYNDAMSEVVKRQFDNPWRCWMFMLLPRREQSARDLPLP